MKASVGSSPSPPAPLPPQPPPPPSRRGAATGGAGGGAAAGGCVYAQYITCKNESPFFSHNLSSFVSFLYVQSSLSGIESSCIAGEFQRHGARGTARKLL